MADLIKDELMLGKTQVNNTWIRMAQVVSYVSNPLFIAPPLFLAIALATSSSLLEGLLGWLIVSLGISGAPLLLIGRGVKRGTYSDHHVSRREQRLVPFLFAACCMVIVLALLLLLHASLFLIATVTGTIGSILIALIITQIARWKISLHLIGITGAVIALGLGVSPSLFVLSPLVLLVGWARWLVHAHTPLQAIAGVAVAVTVTVTMFRAFGL